MGIAVEGLAPSDQGSVSRETVEVADLVLYYGKFPTFEGANSVRIVQFKYSKGLSSVPYRASEITKTIRKFAQAYKSHKKKYGIKNVEKKLAFELITNRPIHTGLTEALQNIASGAALKGDAKKQARQFVSASGVNGEEIRRFAQKVRIIGLAGSLTQNKQALSRVIADWSVARDAFRRGSHESRNTKTAMNTLGPRKNPTRRGSCGHPPRSNSMERIPSVQSLLSGDFILQRR